MQLMLWQSWNEFQVGNKNSVLQKSNSNIIIIIIIIIIKFLTIHFTERNTEGR